MRRTQKGIVAIIVPAILLIIAGGTLRSYVITSASTAPTYLLGDRLIVNLLAYDLTVPFAHMKLVSWANPKRGDMVLVRIPTSPDAPPVVKRVVGVPGENLEVRDYLLFIDRKQLEYTFLDSNDFRNVPPENDIGSIIAIEHLIGTEHCITFTPTMNAERATFGPLFIGPRYYFVLNDNRSNSNDSRLWGLLSREQILGKVIAHFDRKQR